MRETPNLHRGLQRITLDLTRQIKEREGRMHHYRMAEREQQFQFPLAGTVGTLPAEATFKVLFDVLFVFDGGIRRDSQLSEPLSRFGFQIMSAPPGSVPYAYVARWVQDDDFNYLGAYITAGMHNPSIAIAGTERVNTTDFRAVLHASFHGFGLPIDPEGPDDGGGIAGS